MRTRNNIQKNESENGSSQITCQSVVSCAIPKPDFKIRYGKLYYRDKSKFLTIRGGKQRSFGEIAKILGKEGFRDLGFDIPRGEITP